MAELSECQSCVEYRTELAEQDADLAALRAERDRLKEALRPFAEYGAGDFIVHSSSVVLEDEPQNITVGDFKNAALAMGYT